MDFKTIGIPTLKLVIIGAITTALLFGTNNLTAAKIVENNENAAVQSRQEVLAEADGFEEKTVDVDGTQHTYYEATNGAGYVFSATSKGYGGSVETMVGVNAEGQIVGTKVTSGPDETPGLGAKWLGSDPANQERLAQFAGDIPAEGFKVTKDGGSIDSVAGATFTSRAVVVDVNEAVKQYNAVTGGAN